MSLTPMRLKTQPDTSPLVSILLPIYNAATTLHAAVASICAQTYSHWELLLCDDGSTDASLVVARKLAQECGDSRIRVFEGPHVGLAQQLNRAVIEARGSYCARMDADDIAYPERLLRQVELLERRPEVDLVAASIAVFRFNGELLGVRRTVPAHEQLCGRPWASIPMPHPTWMGRTVWFQRNPYRTDALRMEDRELLSRTYSRSVFAGLPEVLLAYREDSLSLRKQLFTRRQTLRHLAQGGPRLGRFLLTAGQAWRFAEEISACATRQQQRLQQRRAAQATAAERKSFNQVWASVHASTLNHLEMNVAATIGAIR